MFHQYQFKNKADISIAASNLPRNKFIINHFPFPPIRQVVSKSYVGTDLHNVLHPTGVHQLWIPVNVREFLSGRIRVAQGPGQAGSALPFDFSLDDAHWYTCLLIYLHSSVSNLAQCGTVWDDRISARWAHVTLVTFQMILCSACICCSFPFGLTWRQNVWRRYIIGIIWESNCVESSWVGIDKCLHV